MEKEIKMMKRMTVFLATLVIGLPSAVAVPKSDGYYGKTKVALAKSENGRKLPCNRSF